MVAQHLISVLRLLAEDPALPVANVPIAPFPTVARLVTGHVSGTAIDLDGTRALIMSATDVESCALELTPGTPGTRRLVARLRTRRRVDLSALREELRRRQPWWSGSVVPDELNLD
ncbi:hypothetical protein GCM10029964_052790 [Kibdelosporangium lantanae]